MSAPPRLLEVRACDRTLRLGERPWLMGIVNATPDSFSDDGDYPTLEKRVVLARELLAAGADVIDIGGESGVTNRPAVAAEEEIARVIPLIERVAGELGALVSVDTYKPAVAEAAIAAGARIVNDVSGLRDPELAAVCARTGAALVIMHTRAAPKTKLLDPGMDGRMAADVVSFLRERIELARAHGVADEQLILDPGPDFGKTPAQTVEVLRRLDDVLALDRPVLMALSRKDFIGAITGRPPRERLAGTLAALGWGADAGGHIFRIHDIAAAAEYLAVRDVLAGRRELAADARLSDRLRWERQQ
ncbi:dihydropteroate synthase [Conexibacter sp. JD483]|uniref:dihydropteroate synthase n=1 Tax=unclassified Conexibacter TaxID=2627773 RepID=UPI0027252F30|nr:MULTISPECIES: dihydropteroate synthase [unclassified Conexibacter]MDO8184704.1 dihydropteroate synthase [Conexibacter sp. CPCC 205706]MDO8198010.1 dihydropteroate synthase [Conexibacter sp. CPCC 205762]MDR9368440.1 dihydropteroate synthase [Conexibacter sp. JD483]